MYFAPAPPIQPAPPRPVYCSECGCEVSTIAWCCANCGNRLHVAGGITYTRPHLGFSVQSRDDKQAKARSDLFFDVIAELAVMLFFVFLSWLKWSAFGKPSPTDLEPIPKLGGLDAGQALMLFICAPFVLYWIWTVVDRLLSIPSKHLYK